MVLEPVQRADRSPVPNRDPGTENPRDAATDQTRIQGQWKLVDADDSDGLSKKEGFAKHTLVIEGDQMWKLRQGGKKEDQGTFKLASEKDPKQIDFKTGGKAKEGQDRIGIYSLDGDKLKICFSTAVPVEETRRPTDFTIMPGSGRVLLVYERESAKPRPGKSVSQDFRYRAYWLSKQDERSEYKLLLITRASLAELQEWLTLEHLSKGARPVLESVALTITTYEKDSIWNVDRQPLKPITRSAGLSAQKRTVEVHEMDRIIEVNGVRYRYEDASLAEVIALLNAPEGKKAIHRTYGPLDGMKQTARGLRLLLDEQLKNDESKKKVGPPRSQP